MPNSQNNLHPSGDTLRNYLAELLPNSQLTVQQVDSSHHPLLLLQTKHVMAGFAFSNGDMTESYAKLYGGFKTYFKEQQRQWDAFDLAFVFCVQPGVSNLDQFCSTVETDVYFCRKFVVPLASPLSASLARLPFLPLTPLDGKTLRPASAQTFLQQCGVPAVLARYIVVQHERGPERIVEDCIAGEFGAPQELTSAANARVLQSDGSAESVRLETITIKNFRAYRKPQTFALGADITILYGPNGFGKTSFFDAVDFVATGGIGRIDSSSDAHFTKTAQHLDTGSEESTVSLSFKCNNAVRKIMRTVKNRKQPHLDGRVADRKTILAELTGREILATDRLDNFVNLFRATHLFNQEQQELTKNFQDDCCLPAEIVSRMLAFQDYTNAASKATKVHEALESVISNAHKEVKELSEQIADETKELDRLRRSTPANSNIEILDAEFESLRARLLAARFVVEPRRPDAAMLRSLRASIEARHSESLSHSERLSGLAKEVAGLPTVRTELANLQQQISQKEKALGEAEERRAANEVTLQEVEQHLRELNGGCAAAQARAELLEWVRSTKPLYTQLAQQQQILSEEVSRLMDTIAQLRANAEKDAITLRSQEDLAVQASDKLKAKRSEAAAVQSLVDSLASWQTNRARLASIAESELAIPKLLETLRSEEQGLVSQRTAMASEEARLSRLIAEVDRGQSELKKLLSQLQGHIRTGTCPLCGEDHGTKDELIRRIQHHLDADAAGSARNDLATGREKSRQLAEQVAGNKRKQQELDGQITGLKDERARLEGQIERFFNSASQLGIVIDPLRSSAAEQLQGRHNQVQQEIDELSRQVQDTTLTIGAARTALTDANNLLATKVAEEANRKETLARHNAEATHLQKDTRLNQISLDIDSEQLARDMQLNLERLINFKAEAAKSQTEATQKRTEMGLFQNESASLKSQLQALRTRLAPLQRTVTQFAARLEEARLPANTGEEMLLSLIAEESRTQAQLLGLRDSTSNLELAIDAATTAAALTTLQQNVRNKERAAEAAAQKRDQHQPWLAYFTKLARLVSAQQNEAISSFTREYGPRTSIIQRRLRSVYGFDDIEIQSKESTISVRVKRHGEELRPTDYFSQSQQQTLLLGLFLTACISQTWSGFAPVFMDDPVTHFDDMNTYAFLDLIVGLLESDVGKRQFIISTCDEKLLQLARQKFHHLGERAVFYRFDAIGPEGPVVEKLNLS
jgi:DNA repair protein SbcC/Rad50